MNRILQGVAVTALAICTTTSCSEKSGDVTGLLDDPTVSDVRVYSATVTLADSSIAVGATTQATAALYDRYHHRLFLSVLWRSSDSTIAAVSAAGVVTGVAPGTARIIASQGFTSASAAVTVTGEPTPATTASGNPGTVTDLKSVAVDTSSVTLSFTQVDDGTGQPAKYDVRYAVSPISWGSAASVTAGTCTTPVAGSSIGTSLMCSVTGLKPSTAYQFQLVAFRGTMNLNAVYGGLSNIVSASTSAPGSPPPPPPVASVSVSPSSATLAVGATTQLSAQTRDANNNVLTGRVVTWASSNTAVAKVSSTGLVTAVAAGTSQVTATSEGQSGTAAITVNAPPPVPVASVSVSPSSATLDVGATTQLSAQTRDANNNVLSGRVITWTSSNSAVAKVSSTGLVTAVAAGTSQVTATSEGKSGTAAITVNAPPPPPPPPPGSNEPPGLTKVSDRPFNSTTATYTAGEDGWWDSDNGALAIVQDATAPRSPTNVARMTFSAGEGGGYAPSTLERPVNGTTVYVAAWVKLSTNWQSHRSSVNKIIHMWINGANRLVITAAGYDPYGPLTARISLQGIVSGGNNADGGISGTYESNVQIVRGEWTKIEVIAVANTAGANNGSVKLYINGVLATSCSGIQFASGNTSWDLISWSPTWGGTGDTITATQYEYMDHFYISQK